MSVRMAPAFARQKAPCLPAAASAHHGTAIPLTSSELRIFQPCPKMRRRTKNETGYADARAIHRSPTVLSTEVVDDVRVDDRFSPACAQYLLSADCLKNEQSY